MSEVFELIREQSFLQRALLAAVLIGFANGFFSGFVNLRRNALSVSALSHTMLPGIAIAVYFTGHLSQLNAFMGALFACLLVGLSSVLVGRNSRIPQATALAILYTSAFAGGIALLPFLPVSVDLHEWLFGEITFVSDSDLKIAFLISAFTLAACILFMRPLLLTLFEPNVAAAQGVPTRLMQYLSFLLLVLMLVASLQAVGCVLSVGLLVAPAATMLLYTDKTALIFWGGGIIGALAGVFGVILSVAIDVQPGPAIVFTLGTVFILSFLLSPRHGILLKRHTTD